MSSVPAYSPFEPRERIYAEDIDDPEIAAVLKLRSRSSESTLIAEVETFIKRYVYVPEPLAYLVLSLWYVATYFAERFWVFPYLSAVSPEKRCGKTRVLELGDLLCSNPLMIVQPSSAVFFRLLQNCPTVLVDEADQLFKPSGGQLSETQQGIVAAANSGYKRGAFVWRCEGRDHHPRKFATYSPKAFASIGALPGTISDRSVIIRMQRKPKSVSLERFLPNTKMFALQAEQLRSQLVQWAAEHGDSVQSCYERMNDLKYLSDRDAEIWMPLFALCSLAAPERLGDLKEAAKMLCGVKQADAEEESTGTRLLADVREVWTSGENISSKDLTDRLLNLEESPWREWEWTPRKLAKALKPYGIHSLSVRLGVGEKSPTLKGYRKVDFVEVWEQYLGASSPE